jgi:hypothetical protein
MKHCEYNTWLHIHNTLLSLYLMIGHNKLESLCLAKLSNLVHYITLYLIMSIHKLQKIKCCKYNNWLHIHNTLLSLYLMMGHNDLESFFSGKPFQHSEM